MRISGHSRSKLRRIIALWLSREPPVLSRKIYKRAKYLLFDGTYFHKHGCLAIFMNNTSKSILFYAYTPKESYHNVYPMAKYLKEHGLMPKAITLDGHIKVIDAIMDVWPSIAIQRCLYHIQRQGLSWLRTYPKTEAGKALRVLLNSLMNIKTKHDKAIFMRNYDTWLNKYRIFIKSLPRNSVANIDLKRTMVLINNALPNMFHYLKDQNIASTTNLLENFYSQLKHHYRSHRGMVEQHKISYLKWFCYLKSCKNNNTF